MHNVDTRLFSAQVHFSMLLHPSMTSWIKTAQRFLVSLWHQLLGVFNLNDGKWGRSGGDSQPTDNQQPGAEPSAKPDASEPGKPSSNPNGNSGGNKPTGPQGGPPDLDELWRDFNRKLGGLFGQAGKTGQGGNTNNTGGGQGNGGGGFTPPSMKGAGIGAGAILSGIFLIWLGSGFFIVQEGQQAVITRFGKFLGPEKGIKGAGVNWRLPYPIERHEVVGVSRLRSVDVGRGVTTQAASLRDSSMLTQDENIVDIRMVVQYRLKDSAEFLFNNQDPEQAVVLAAESAIREVVGKGSMNTVLNEKREAIANDVVKSIQTQLDQYKTGILISSVNIQNVQPPEQVQAAFDDALKAGQDGDRAKNEGQAYANDVLPRAKGTASRLKEEAEGYKQRVVAQAQGDAERFKSILVEYQKAPQVTRDRMYLDAMSQIYSNVTKIMVDSRTGNNMLYLPLDKIIAQSASGTADAPATGSTAVPGASPTPAATPAPAPSPSADPRSRDNARNRDTR
jgi:modulator of FtsH protease HflK